MLKFNSYLKDNNSCKIFTLLAYSLLTWIGITHHEPWRDEADSWLVAQDLPWSDYFTHTANVGMPGLWWLMLMPLAKAGLPYFSMHILHWIIAIAMSAIVLWKAPFSILVRIAIIFSAHLSYEFAVIARHYNLVLLLLFAAASLYPSRYKYPIIYTIILALMANVNAIIFGALLGLGLIFVIGAFERNILLNFKILFSLLIMGAGAFIALYQLWPNNQTYFTGFVSQNILIDPPAYIRPIFAAMNGYIIRIGPFIINSGWLDSSSENEANLYIIIFIGITACIAIAYIFLPFLILSYKAIRNNQKISIFFLCSIVWLMYLFTFKYLGEARHHSFIFITAFVSLWLHENESKYSITKKNTEFNIPISDKKNLTFNLAKTSQYMLMFSLFNSVFVHYMDFRMPFSGSKSAAEFILENNIKTEDLIDIYSYSSIIPHLRKDRKEASIWSINTENNMSYSVFNKTFWEADRKPVHEIIQNLKEKNYTLDGKIFAIRDSNIKNPSALNLQQVYYGSGLVEKISLYQHNSNIK